jgi:hypothetical protein
MGRKFVKILSISFQSSNITSPLRGFSCTKKLIVFRRKKCNQNYFFVSGDQIHAYDNTAFSGGSQEMEERKPDSKSDVERMGYEMYNGKSADKR